MTLGPKVRSNDSVNLDIALGVLAGFEPPHSPLALTCRLMRVLRAVVQMPVLPVRNARHHHSPGHTVTAELVSNNDSRFTPGCPQQPAEEANGGKPIPPGLDQNIEHNTVLIDSSPQIMRDTIDLEEDFIQMPFIAGPGTPSPQAFRELAAKFVAPAPDGFAAHYYATGSHHFLHVTEAYTEPEVQPHAFRDDLLRESVAMAGVVRHSFSIASHSALST